MSETTANLALPYIMPSQAQKHVTHNEALQLLDAVTQLTLTAALGAPPANPEEGECYFVAAPASGGFAGKAGKIALRQDGAWLFITPKEGWRAVELATGRLKIFSADAWVDAPLPDTASLSALGIHTSVDDYNRLALSVHASLFTHDGNGHQIKVNKASVADTASLLFQTDWQGRAEMGLAGSDDFVIKVSPDGAAWTTALTITPQGRVLTPARPLARAALAASIVSPAAGSQTGFDDLHVVQGNFTLGAMLPSGLGKRLVVPASGIYLVVLNIAVVASASHGVEMRRNGTTSMASIAGANGTGNVAFQSTSAIAWLDAGDWLGLQYAGNPQLQFGYDKTELMIVMI